MAYKKKLILRHSSIQGSFPVTKTIVFWMAIDYWHIHGIWMWLIIAYLVISWLLHLSELFLFRAVKLFEPFNHQDYPEDCWDSYQLSLENMIKLSKGTVTKVRDTFTDRMKKMKAEK